jgi:hypothetical protein
LLFFFLFVSAAEKGKARDEATLGSGRMTQNSCCLFKHRPTIDDDHRLHEKAETNEEKKKKKVCTVERAPCCSAKLSVLHVAHWKD